MAVVRTRLLDASYGQNNRVVVSVLRTGVVLAVLVLAARGTRAQPQDRPLPSTAADRLARADIVFTGFDVLPPDRLEAMKKKAPLQTGKPVALSGLQQTARLALAALRNAGYAYARIDVLETTVAPGHVRIEFRADPGLQTVFGPIDITGNTSVADSVVRRELAYMPGQVFSAAAMEESQRRLQRLGIFESAEITLLDPVNQSAGAPTRVTVKERDLTPFTYAAGYGSEEQLFADATWRHLNFLGGARTFSARGRWSWLDRGVEGGFIQPYLFRPGLTLGVRGYVWDVDDATYDVLSKGGGASLAYEMGRNTLTGSYVQELAHVRIPIGAQIDEPSRVQLTTLGVDATSGAQNGVLAALQFGATRDARDEAMVESGEVTRGYLAAIRLEQAGGWLPGRFNYVSVSGDVRYYRGAGRVTIAGRLQYGAIDPMGPRSDIPFSKRYFLGGSDTLRGWGRLEVSPRSPSSLPLGGQSFAVTSGELRIPVAGPFGAVLFVDAGNVWANTWALSARLRSDGGTGLRYRSPFGLFRVDVGYQFTPIEGLTVDGNPKNRRWRIHVDMGHTF